MLTFRNINIAAILIAVLLWIFGAAWWAYVLVFLVHSAIAYWGTTQICSHFHMPAYCKAKNHPTKEIAITFDDSVLIPEQTNQVLDILKKYNIPATFFCIGKNLEEEAQQETLKRMDEEGHLIGNHSYSHSTTFDFYSADRIEKELHQTDYIILNIIGKRPNFFRPPYGITTPKIARAVQRTKHNTIGWSVRSLDTVIKDKKKLFTRVTSQLGNGDIILFHDHLEHIPSFLPTFLEYVLNKGYNVVRADQLLQLKAYKD